MTLRTLLTPALLLLVAAVPALAGTAWQRPPQAVLDVLHAPESPLGYLSPDGDTLLLARPVRYPPIDELARPMLRLAGVRVDPALNAPHGETWFDELSLVDVGDGSRRAVTLPADPRVTRMRFSADGRRFAFAHRATDGLELWIGEVATGRAQPVPGLRLNPVLGSEVRWMPDQRSLLVKRVPPDRGPAPVAAPAPPGPRILESADAGASSTYEARDVLTGPHDEALFEHHGLSQLVLVDASSLAVTPVGAPGLIAGATPSPDGRHLLVETLHEPWSYQHAWWRFPRNVEVWDRGGAVTHVVAKLPLADQVPIHGVPTGPRSVTWRDTEPATLVWIEALDGGDPGRKVDHRDRMMAHAAPFSGEPREVHRAAHRVQGWWWGEDDDLMVVSEWERERRWRHVWAVDAGAKPEPARKLWDLSVNDAYADPGWFVERTRSDGTEVLLQDGDRVFLAGDGSTPEGDRPFLDRFSLETRKTERLWRSDAAGYERFLDFVDARKGTFLTRAESPATPPNFHVRTLSGKPVANVAAGEASRTTTARALTSFDDPTPQLRGIQKRIVKYERADGVPLSFTLYTPPGYVEGTRLPTVVWAYPLEYSDPATAGQVSGTDRQFTRLLGTTPLFFLLDGYAVLMDVTMPVIGDPDTAYDTFIEQLVSSADAAVKHAVELGVTDPERVGVAGHSHGALMTATLLAHSDIFRAGIARSGAYNHTMRPFGFQSERRTMWQVPENYVRLSPTMHADKIKEPLLLIHGEVDQNPGTVPLQSEKLFECVRGTGGTVRLLMLPHESHGYRSIEAVEHVLAEQLAWFDRYVKRAAPRQGEVAAGQ